MPQNKTNPIKSYQNPTNLPTFISNPTCAAKAKRASTVCRQSGQRPEGFASSVPGAACRLRAWKRSVAYEDVGSAYKNTKHEASCHLKTGYFENPDPCYTVQIPPLEGPMILREVFYYTELSQTVSRQRYMMFINYNNTFLFPMYNICSVIYNIFV